MTRTYYQDREDWLRLRKEQPGFGGSEMTHLVNPPELAWTSPFRLVCEKAGLIDRPDKDNFRMWWGRECEEKVAKRFELISGKKVHNENCIFSNEDFPHMFATIDRKVEGETAGLECKTTSELSSKRFRDGEFPVNYYVQCCTYLAVTGWTTWYLAVVVGETDEKYYVITRDPDMQKPDWAESITHIDQSELDALNDLANHYWGYVVSKTPPPVQDGKRNTLEALKILRLEANVPAAAKGETQAELATQFDALLNERAEKVKAIEAIQADIDTIEAQLRQELTRLNVETAKAGQYKVSLKTSTRKTLDSKRIAAELKLGDEWYKTSQSITLRIS